MMWSELIAGFIEQHKKFLREQKRDALGTSAPDVASGQPEGLDNYGNREPSESPRRDRR
jgi:hypothetical protein